MTATTLKRPLALLLTIGLLLGMLPMSVLGMDMVDSHQHGEATFSDDGYYYTGNCTPTYAEGARQLKADCGHTAHVCDDGCTPIDSCDCPSHVHDDGCYTTEPVTCELSTACDCPEVEVTREEEVEQTVPVEVEVEYEETVPVEGGEEGETTTVTKTRTETRNETRTVKQEVTVTEVVCQGGHHTHSDDCQTQRTLTCTREGEVEHTASCPIGSCPLAGTVEHSDDCYETIPGDVTGYTCEKYPYFTVTFVPCNETDETTAVNVVPDLPEQFPLTIPTLTAPLNAYGEPVELLGWFDEDAQQIDPATLTQSATLYAVWDNVQTLALSTQYEGNIDINWSRSPETEDGIYKGGFFSASWSTLTEKLIPTVIGEAKVWDGSTDSPYFSACANKNHAGATWRNDGWVAPYQSSVRRIQGTFTLPNGYSTNDTFLLTSVARDIYKDAGASTDVLAINDNVYIFLYQQSDASKITDDNYLDYLVFFSGNSTAKDTLGNLSKTANGRYVTKWEYNWSPHKAKNWTVNETLYNLMTHSDGWYTEADWDNIGARLFENYPSAKAGDTFVIDIFAEDTSSDHGGGMDKLALQYSKAPSTDLTVTVEYYKDAITPANKLGEKGYSKTAKVDDKITLSGNWLTNFQPSGYQAGQQVGSIPYVVSNQENNVIQVLYSDQNALKTSFTVTKVWQHGENTDLPTSVSMQLKADGEDYGSVVTLSADNDWTYTWNDLPRMAGNREISYTVTESALQNYTPSTPAPTATPVSVNPDNITVVSAKNASSFTGVNGSFVAAFKGNDFMVWTKNGLTQDEQSAFVRSFAGAVTVTNFKNITTEKTTFFHGANGSYGGITVSEDTVTFDSKSDWSQFAHGGYAFGLNATVTNTYNPPAPPTSYTLSYTWTGLPAGANLTPPVNQTYHESDTVTLDDSFGSSSTVKVGHDTYTFSGWTSVTPALNDGKMPASNVEVSGSWSVTATDPTYTVTYTKGSHGTFDSDGHSGLYAGDPTPDFAGTIDSATNNPAGEAGWTFAGWEPSVSSTVSGNQIYVAQWTASDATTYRVEFYYEQNGTYSENATSFVSRTGTTDSPVSVTDADKTSTSTRHVLDTTRVDQFSGTVAGDNTLVLKVYFKEQFTVVYKPGTRGNFEEQTTTGLFYGDATPDAPNTPSTGSRYLFNGWSPAPAETVTADAEYVAQWRVRNNPTPPTTDPTTPDPDPVPDPTDPTPVPNPEPTPETDPDIDITDPDVPMGELPELPEPELPDATGEIEIIDPDVPMGELPHTGFEVTRPFWVITLMALPLSLSALGLHILFPRKEDEQA